jgi:hypothetical protein
LREHGSIEGIIAALKIEPPVGFTFEEARAEFERPGVMDAPGPVRPVYTEDDISAIDRFLRDSGLSAARYAKALGTLAALK